MQMAERGFLHTRDAKLRAVTPESELFKLPDGAVKFTQEQLLAIAKQITGARHRCRCLGIVYAHTRYAWLLAPRPDRWLPPLAVHVRVCLTCACMRTCVLHARVCMYDACTVTCACACPERGFLARVEDEKIELIEPASGQEVYPETDRASWAHPDHPTRECPYDMWARKRATFGPNWC